MLIAAKTNLKIATADIGNAFINAPCKEKVWTIAGDEFGDKKGAKISLARALYGLASASRAFHEFLGDTFLRMGFRPSRADQDIWYRLSEDGKTYEYIASHVDDIIIVSKDPREIMNALEQEYILHYIIRKTNNYYLGMNLKKMEKGYMHISSHKYITEVLRKYNTTYKKLGKPNLPLPVNTLTLSNVSTLPVNTHPELDDSELLDEKGITQYQHIIGVGQWLVTAGRVDIAYAVSSMSRFSAAPRKGHLKLAEQIFEYLNKYPKCGYTINPNNPQIPSEYQDVSLPQDFGNQYHYFKEELDPKFPEPKIDEFPITIFCDSDHGHDKKTGRSITGILVFIGSTPV